MENLTEDVVFQIFLKLPIKSLLACKCVCRTWRSLIRQGYFIDKHLIQSTQERYISNLIVQFHRHKYYHYYFDSCDLAYIQKVRIATTKICHHLNDSIHPLNGNDMDIIGSCNGLLCFKNRGIATGIYIGNPIKRDYVLLPPLTSPSNCVLGFGFDAWTGQCKVVCSILNCNYRMEMEMEICTVESSGNPSPSWRRIENSSLSIYCYGSRSVFADGALHWVNHTYHNNRESDVIVSLDMRDEKFRVMPWPDLLENPGHRRKILHEWRGRLSIFDYPCPNSILIWVFKDCKGKMDWSEELRIEWSVPFDVDSCYLIPLGIKKNREILLSDRMDLASYDINNKRLTSLELCDTWRTEVITDVVTLVSSIVYE